MKIVLIDDERPALDDLSYLLKSYDAEIIGTFTNPVKAFDSLAQLKPEVVFLDIDMPVLNGIELGIKIQSLLPEIILVFVTAYSEYALEAFKAYPLDYMLKPVNEERLARTIDHIEKTIEKRGQKNKATPLIRCFGNFEVINGNAAVRFPTQKARELLAYLICNSDQAVYRDELIYALFGNEDDKKNANNLRVTLYRLRNALSAIGINNEQVSIKEDYALTIQDRICDFIDFCRFIKSNKSVDDANIDYAERILALYQGDLLSDWDVLWVVENREWARIQFEETMLKVAFYYISKQQSRNAERVLLQLIENHPFADQGYELLLDIYMETGAIPKYSHYYRRYTRLMEEELDSMPDEKYAVFFAKNCR
ncbi:MAG: response regulator [Syntrophomonadaceae bacterium]|nr:response regulator [Syntrophomonadaceae bacterium]